MKSILGLGLAILFCGVSDKALAERRTSDNFHADADVVLVNATVLDGHDRPVRGLTRNDFQIYEDKAMQNIAYFSEEETPLSLAVIFDVSGSMQGKMAGMRSALDAVLQSANTQDEFSLITFADQPAVAASWTPNPEEIQSRLLQASAHGQTSLLDALETGLATMKHARNARKAMLIFSDGGDNHSRATERELMRSLAEAGVQIYAVDTIEPLFFRQLSPEEIIGPDLLERLSEHAGGRYFQVNGKRDLAATAEQISRELRSQYVLGYVPAGDAKDGRFHPVRVQVGRKEGMPKISVFSRPGYRATGE
jgi:Ca-activated chloride channel family protein